MSMNDLIDPTMLGQYKEVMGDEGEAFIQDLVQTYVDTSPNIFAQLEAAFQSADFETFQRSAHSLKSTTAVMGAAELSEQFKALEEQGAARDLEGVSDTLSGVKNELKNVITVLSATFLE